ncbi:MAG: amidohydrolase family protein [Thermogemmatispora sp.]|uniref:amidohydrolase family protein n=1 Tax=Thermogemmatispora sp. TaxID=1968838 RepID=UPI001A0B2C7D|nr:amidohydrolase family protein [Thermogemmatispora sp.]MBE3564564.1 amidohydrolase family protein [Thermogemmatispora sp.]
MRDLSLSSSAGADELLPVIDAHVHFWDPQRFHMPWLEAHPQLKRSFGPEDYRRETQGLPIEALVYVEVVVAPEEALREAAWIVEVAQEEPRLKAIVAAAPLEQGLGVRAHLEALRALSPLIKGVRRNIENEAEDDFCLRPAFVDGVRLLADYGLSCDVCVRHQQLASVVELVRRCPDTHFILDHLGKPPIRTGEREPWRQHIQALGELPNVVCKVSGMVTEADHERWSAYDLVPYLGTVMAAFGPERLLFGGDWPVVLLASSYRRWYEALRTMLSAYPLYEQRLLWSETARRVYRLEDSAPGHSPARAGG